MRSTLLCIVLVALLGGCSWVGRTAGKAKAHIESGAQSMEAGYDEGYAEEKSKQKE